MKDNPKLHKQFSIRLPKKDYEKLLKAVGPYGKVSGLVRALIKSFLEKSDTKAA